MSNPKDKANELYSKYDDLLNKDFGNPIVFDNQIKQCALIAVDEIIEALEEHQWQNRHIIEDYKLIKQEIEKL